MRFFRRAIVLDSLLLTILVVVLIKPLFRLKYLDNWPSIESTFISDARILSEHLPHSGWQPLWYCGTRADYIYPPALRYGTVLISQIGHVIPARAYHLYTAVFYVLGILAVYWLVRTGSGSRISGLLASTATALLSPSFLLLPGLRKDSGFLVPQRLHVLMAYGEGPHISALAVLPAALAASLIALRKKNLPILAAAGTLCALIVATNFYGATALAILYPILVWSVWVTERDRTMWLRALAIPVLAWGLSAFWLTPSYLHITLVDLKWVSQPASAEGRAFFAAVIAIYAVAALRTGKRKPDRQWPIFVAGAALALSVYVLSFFYLHWSVTGDAARLVPELDFALILAGAELARRLCQKQSLRLPVTLALLLAFLPSARYLKHAWSPFPKSAPLEKVYQYKMAGWVHDHLPGARVLPVGTVRLWFDAWSDDTQPDGGSMQGMLNQIIPVATWQILTGDRPDLATLWLQALGTDAAIVPASTSQEWYHDYQHPDKFRGVLTAVRDDGQGTVIYAVPRIHPGIVRVVDRAAIAAAARISGGDDNAALANYVALVENPLQPAATLQWRGFDAADVHAKTNPGQTVLVQETFDPAWHAYEDDRQLPIRVEDKMGFMLIDAPPGDHAIRLQFESPLENRIGEIFSILTAIVIIGLVFAPRVLSPLFL